MYASLVLFYILIYILLSGPVEIMIELISDIILSEYYQYKYIRPTRIRYLRSRCATCIDCMVHMRARVQCSSIAPYVSTCMHSPLVHSMSIA
jgi:hypothetical protein